MRKRAVAAPLGGVKLLLLDCDSTLAAIEGVDELARARGPEIFASCAELTDAAMDGRVAVEDVFGRRMDIIRPSRETAEAVAQAYRQAVLPGAREAIAELKSSGWTPVIVSGGFAPLILPLAADLGIQRVEAVPLFFDANGDYAGYGTDFPTTRGGGKPEIVAALREELRPETIVLLGDGASDLEAREEVDLFIAFFGVVRRPLLAEAQVPAIQGFDELPALIRGHWGED